jgi:hypothetical protein
MQNEFNFHIKTLHERLLSPIEFLELKAKFQRFERNGHVFDEDFVTQGLTHVDKRVARAFLETKARPPLTPKQIEVCLSDWRSSIVLSVLDLEETELTSEQLRKLLEHKTIHVKSAAIQKVKHLEENEILDLLNGEDDLSFSICTAANKFQMTPTILKAFLKKPRPVSVYLHLIGRIDRREFDVDKEDLDCLFSFARPFLLNSSWFNPTRKQFEVLENDVEKGVANKEDFERRRQAWVSVFEKKELTLRYANQEVVGNKKRAL